MVTHYPTKRSVLVPTLLYAQDEAGFLSDEVIEEIAGRLDLTELEVRNVVSYYSMLTTKPRGRYNVQSAPILPACCAVARNCLSTARKGLESGTRRQPPMVCSHWKK